MDTGAKGEASTVCGGVGRVNADSRRKPENYYPKFELLVETAARVVHNIESRTGRPELKTGLEVLDTGLFGLHKSQMTVWAARPGVGKTSFACQVAMNLAEQKHKVAFLSLEMTKESILERCFSLKTATPGQDLMRGVVSVSLKNKLLLFVNYCESLSLRIVDDYCHTENELYTLVEHLEFRPDVLILDHIQHIRAVERRSQWECLTEYLRYLKEIAMKYKIAVVVLSQINRTGEEAPTLANLKGTGAIEEMADSVLLFHRPDQLTEDGSNMVIEVAKNRFGPTGQFNLFFDGSCYRFYNNNHEATMAMVSEGRSGIV